MTDRVTVGNLRRSHRCWHGLHQQRGAFRAPTSTPTAFWAGPSTKVVTDLGPQKPGPAGPAVDGPAGRKSTSTTGQPDVIEPLGP